MKVQAGVLTPGSMLGGQPSLIRPNVAANAMAVLLFGKRPPRLVDKRKHPKLAKALKKLGYVKDQIAEMLGRSGEDFTLELCEGSNASISRDGQIAFGLELLEEHQSDDDLLVAVLGHEMGHQPWSWPQGDLSHLTRKELHALAREEEAKADRFAGRVLAELDADPDSICAFLEAAEDFEHHKTEDYFPVAVRALMIRESFQRRKRRRDSGRAVFGGAALKWLR